MRGGCRRRPLRRRNRLGARARCRVSCGRDVGGLDCAGIGTKYAWCSSLSACACVCLWLCVCVVSLSLSVALCACISLLRSMFSAALCLSICVSLRVSRSALSSLVLSSSGLRNSLSSPPPPVPIVHSFLQLRRQCGLQSVVDERAVRVPAKTWAREVEPRLILGWVRHRNGGRQLLCKSCIQRHTKACDTDPHLCEMCQKEGGECVAVQLLTQLLAGGSKRQTRAPCHSALAVAEEDR